MMTTLEELKEMFAAESRPDEFTDFNHCEECADHNETLKKYDRYAIPQEDLSNPGWDPICFVTPEAFRYLFPRLCELAYGQGSEYYLVPGQKASNIFKNKMLHYRNGVEAQTGDRRQFPTVVL